MGAGDSFGDVEKAGRYLSLYINKLSSSAKAEDLGQNEVPGRYSAPEPFGRRRPPHPPSPASALRNTSASQSMNTLSRDDRCRLCG